MISVAQRDFDRLKVFQQAAVVLLVLAVAFRLPGIVRSFELAGTASDRLGDPGWKKQAYISAGWRSFWSLANLILIGLRTLAVVEFVRYMLDRSSPKPWSLRNAVWIFILSGVLGVVDAANSTYSMLTHALRMPSGTSGIEALYYVSSPLSALWGFVPALFYFLLAYLIYGAGKASAETEAGAAPASEETLEVAAARVLDHVWLPNSQRNAAVVRVLRWVQRFLGGNYYRLTVILAWMTALILSVNVSTEVSVLLVATGRVSPIVAAGGFLWDFSYAQSHMLPETIALVGLAGLLRYYLDSGPRPGWCTLWLVPALYLLAVCLLIHWPLGLVSVFMNLRATRGMGVSSPSVLSTLCAQTWQLASALLGALLYAVLARGIPPLLSLLSAAKARTPGLVSAEKRTG